MLKRAQTSRSAFEITKIVEKIAPFKGLAFLSLYPTIYARCTKAFTRDLCAGVHYIPCTGYSIHSGNVRFFWCKLTRFGLLATWQWIINEWALTEYADDANASNTNHLFWLYPTDRHLGDFFFSFILFLHRLVWY